MGSDRVRGWPLSEERARRRLDHRAERSPCISGSGADELYRGAGPHGFVPGHPRGRKQVKLRELAPATLVAAAIPPATRLARVNQDTARRVLIATLALLEAHCFGAARSE